MDTGRSFAEFVKDKCYNGSYQAAEDFVARDWESLNEERLMAKFG